MSGFVDYDVALVCGDALELCRDMPHGSVAGVVTSPPYLDMRPEYSSPTSAEWLELFDELARVTRGGIALNVGRLWRQSVERLWYLELLEAARKAGLELRDTLIWVKPNGNPIQGAVFANSHEYVFLLSREPDAFYPDAMRTPYAEDSLARLERRWISSISVKGDTSARNGARRDERRGERHEANPAGARARSFLIAYAGGEKGNGHPAPMPIRLARSLVELVAMPGERVLDPFAGSGTTLLAARETGRLALGFELSPAYCVMAGERLAQQALV